MLHILGCTFCAAHLYYTIYAPYFMQHILFFRLFVFMRVTFCAEYVVLHICAAFVVLNLCAEHVITKYSPDNYCKLIVLFKQAYKF